MHKNFIPYLIGIIVGIVIGYIIFASGPLGNRYSLNVSSDGSTVHKIDARSGRVWVKSAHSENGPEGNPVTVYFWEELLTDRPGATALAKNKRDSAIEEQQAELEQKRQEDIEEFQIKQRRINDISALCGEDMVCVHEKCSSGYQGAPDPEWTSYCSETIYTNLAKLVITQCEGNEWCIKNYCKDKHNNTYPAVSDCVKDINLVRLKSENEAPPDPPQ